MGRLPRRSGHEFIKILAQFGFKRVRQKGSHVVFIKETKQGKVGCVVPLHWRQEPCWQYSDKRKSAGMNFSKNLTNNSLFN